MGSSTSCFRSQVPPALTSEQILHLTSRCQLSPEDIKQWYDRFVHCYPHGRLSRRQFVYYYQELLDEHGPQWKPLVKQLFRVFDLNDDNKLDFHEFVLLNVMTRQGSIDDKLNLVFSLYDKDKDKYLSRDELKDLLKNMFDLLEISSSKSNLTRIIDLIFARVNLNRDDKISWNEFTKHVLNDRSLRERIVPVENDFYPLDNEQLVHRTERF